MFNRFDPTVEAVIRFLHLLQVKVNPSTVNETLQNHPDWPSLLCVSDALHKWNVPNAAGKIEKEDIDRIPVPFLTHRLQCEVVTDVTETAVTFWTNNKTFTKPREEYLQKWNGIYLMAEPSPASGEKEYATIRRNVWIKRLIPTSLLLLLFLLWGIDLYQKLSAPIDLPVAGMVLQSLLLLAGIGVSCLLLWHEIDRNNPILKKVCTGIVKGNCDAILSGRQSKVFSWLSWSEVGFFYFAGGLLSLLFATPADKALAVVACFNLLALPYTVFSIYYQGRVARQWCVLCLCVQVLLLLGGANVVINGLQLPLFPLSWEAIGQCFFAYLLPVTGWYALKPYLLRLQKAKNTQREYLRVKFNTEVFDALLHKQRKITFPVDGLGINLGNPEAKNTLVKVCNPYCGPCGRAHFKIEKLMSELPDLKVKIIFTAPNNPDDMAYQPVCHLLAIEEQGDHAVLKNALDDWYTQRDYTALIAKYPVTITDKQHQQIAAMYQWCEQTAISYTPTLFINGYEVPKVYDLEDVVYFLNE
jgi:hypothetical protein